MLMEECILDSYQLAFEKFFKVDFQNNSQPTIVMVGGSSASKCRQIFTIAWIQGPCC